MNFDPNPAAENRVPAGFPTGINSPATITVNGEPYDPDVHGQSDPTQVENLGVWHRVGEFYGLLRARMTAEMVERQSALGALLLAATDRDIPDSDDKTTVLRMQFAVGAFRASFLIEPGTLMQVVPPKVVNYVAEKWVSDMDKGKEVSQA